MQSTCNEQIISSNPLTKRLFEYTDSKGIALGDLAAKLGLTKVYLEAIFNGTRDIQSLPIHNIRIIASLLGIPCTTALVLCGALKEADFE